MMVAIKLSHPKHDVLSGGDLPLVSSATAVIPKPTPSGPVWRVSHRAETQTWQRDTQTAVLRPLSRLIKSTITASTSRMWMKPPSV
jgi:hypothetical protein